MSETDDDHLIRKSRALAQAERRMFRKLVADRDRLDAITDEIDQTLTRLGRFAMHKPTITANVIDIALGGDVLSFKRRRRTRKP